MIQVTIMKLKDIPIIIIIKSITLIRMIINKKKTFNFKDKGVCSWYFMIYTQSISF